MYGNPFTLTTIRDGMGRIIFLPGESAGAWVIVVRNPRSPETTLCAYLTSPGNDPPAFSLRSVSELDINDNALDASEYVVIVPDLKSGTAGRLGAHQQGGMLSVIDGQYHLCVSNLAGPPWVNLSAGTVGLLDGNARAVFYSRWHVEIRGPGWGNPQVLLEFQADV